MSSTFILLFFRAAIIARYAPSWPVGRRRDVVRVAGHAVAADLGVDLRATGAGVLEFLENHDAGALTHDEAVAVLVPRPRGARWLVVELGRKRAAGAETRDAERVDRRLGTARDHDVGVAERDQPGRVADRVNAGGAGGDDAVVRALEAVFDREVAGGEVDQRGRNEERREPPRLCP